MPKLYELADNFRVALALAEDYAADHEGELPEDLSDALDKAEADRDAKIANVLRAMKNEASDAEAFKAEADRLAKKAKARSGRVEWLKQYLAACLGEGNEWKDDVFALSWRNYPAVEITDIDDVPEEYKSTTITISANKVDIKKALKAGTAVPGATLADNPKLQIK